MSTPNPDKGRRCTICKQLRAGHPKTGCPNAIVIPISPSSSSPLAQTIHLQATTLPPSATTQYYDNSGRSPSAKPTQAQLNSAEAYWRYAQGTAGPSVSAYPHPSSTSPGQNILGQMPWPSNAEWQLMLAGQLDQSTGRWNVVTRDMVAGASGGPSHLANGQLLNNNPYEPPFSRGATPFLPGGWPMAQGPPAQPLSMWGTTNQVQEPSAAVQTTPASAPNVRADAVAPDATQAATGRATGSQIKELTKLLFASVLGAATVLYWL